MTIPYTLPFHIIRKDESHGIYGSDKIYTHFFLYETLRDETIWDIKLVPNRANGRDFSGPI
jgi:hypothetical protein